MPKVKIPESKELQTTALMSFQFIMPREDDPLVYESNDLMRKAQKVIIKNEKGRDQVNEMLVRVKGLLKDAKEKRELLIKPIKNQLLNPVDSFFRSITDPLTKAEKMFKLALVEWMVAEEEKTRELAEILRETDNAVAIMADLAPENKLESSNGSRTTATSVWMFTINNTDEIPVEHLRAAVKTKRGEEAIHQIIAALVAGGTRVIPGVTIEETKRISVTLK